MIRMDPQSWDQGRAAGMTGGAEACPPNVSDELAYYAGYMEGKALREQGTTRSAAADPTGATRGL